MSKAKEKLALNQKLEYVKTKLKNHNLNKNLFTTASCMVVAMIMAMMSVLDVFGAYDAVYEEEPTKVYTATIVTQKDVILSLTERFSAQPQLSPITESIGELTNGFEVYADGELVGVVSKRGKAKIEEALCEILSGYEGQNAEIYQEITFNEKLFNEVELLCSATVLNRISPKVLVCQTETDVKEIPFETVYEDTNTLAKGETKVKTQGKNGKITTKTEIKYLDGEEISREVVDTKTEKAVNEVILNGTKSIVTLSDKQIEALDGSCFPLTGSSWYVSSDFGYRSFDGTFHDGIDYASNAGTPVYSAWDGVVVFAGWDNSGYGNYVVVEHANGYRTGYAHLREIVVSNGETVSAGQLLGAVGSTGNSTGNHLHFNVRLDGSYVNPSQFF